MKKLLSLFLVLCLAIGTVGCSGNTKENSSNTDSTIDTSAGNGKKVTITVWRAAGESKSYDETFADFNNTHDDIQIESTTLQAGTSYSDQIRAAAASGDLPDVLLVDGPEMASLCYSNILAPLDSYITPEFKADLLPSIISQGTYKDGQIYLLGQFDGGLALWANKEMLEQANVRIPTGPDDAWTKDEFDNALKSLKSLPGIEYPLDMKVNYGQGYWVYSYLPIVKSFGGDLINRNTMIAEGIMNSEATVNALSYLKGLVDNGYVNKAQSTDDDFFGTKKSALMLAGHWTTPDVVKGLGDNAVLVPIPNFGNGVYTGIGSLAWGMTTKAVEDGVDKQAYEVIMSLFTEKSQKAIYEESNVIPSRISVLNLIPEYQPGGKLYLYRKQLEDGLGYVRPVTPAFSTIQNSFGTACINVMNGTDPKEALDKATSEIDTVISEAGYNK